MTSKIKSVNGVKTPAMIADECKRYGKLIAIDSHPFMRATRQFYDMSYLNVTDKIMEVTITETGSVVSARYVPATVARTLSPVGNKRTGNSDFHKRA